MTVETELARKAISTFLKKNQFIKPPDTTPDELIQQQAGVFVSLHQNDDLRGCIGTITPVQNNIAEEIIHNAVSAATQDPRFQPLDPKELPKTHISVDVLTEPLPASKKDLDPRKYGVIVKEGNRTGVLLPNLPGLTNVDEQIQIACQKAGLDPNGPFSIYKFEVKRSSE